jgi:preprotein translocase subunit SecA
MTYIVVYSCDITYGTASEFVFDYLRDSGTTNSAEEHVQRIIFWIAEKIDSILIDEARIPFIIAGSSDCDDCAPFSELKPADEIPASLRPRLCNNFPSNANSSLESGQASKEDSENSWQIQLKMPKTGNF